MVSRRQIIKGAAVSSLIAISGVSIWQLSLTDTQQVVEEDNYNYQHLNLDHRLVLFAIIPAMLGEALAKLDDKKFSIKIIQQLDQAIDYLSRANQQELRQLLDLLANQLGRAYLAAVWQSWNKADSKAITQFLQSWRTSYFTILRSGYFGLHQLIMGAFYAQPESWQAINYPGPAKLNLPDDFYQQFEL